MSLLPQGYVLNPSTGVITDLPNLIDASGDKLIVRPGRDLILQVTDDISKFAIYVCNFPASGKEIKAELERTGDALEQLEAEFPEFEMKG